MKSTFASGRKMALFGTVILWLVRILPDSSMIDGNPQTYVEYGKWFLSRRPAFGSCAPACRQGAGDKRDDYLH